MDYSDLKGRIRAKYKTQEAFAAAMGICLASLSKKLNNRTQWTRLEIEKACNLLDIPLTEVSTYFFCTVC